MEAAEFQERVRATDAQLQDLERYRGLLAEWNERINLVGPSALAQFWDRHARDSAQLLDPAPEARVWADLGTGAGLPGVVLAVLLKGRGGARVHLVDSLVKRCRFLEEVVRELELPAQVHVARAETLALANVEVVTARACAPMTRLLGYAEPILRRGAFGLFLKGEAVETELTEARRAWSFDAELFPSASDSRGRVVRIRRLKRARQA